MALVPANITTELLEHADGRPIAYIDATAIAIFAYQWPGGAYVIDICTREDIAAGRLRLLLDSGPLLRASPALAAGQAMGYEERSDAERAASSPSRRPSAIVQP